MKIFITFILGFLCGIAGSKIETRKMTTGSSARQSAPLIRDYTVINADTVELSDGTRIKYNSKKPFQYKDPQP